MISPTCGSWIGARDLPGDPPRVRADRPPGGLLGAAACVGAAVEPPARGALVDLPGPLGDRLAQPVGVAAGVLHLVGVRRPVDAAVGQPPGRQPGPPPPAEPAALLAFAGGTLEHLPEVDVLVELLELAGAGGRDRLLERVGERPRSRPVAGVGAVTFAGIGRLPRLHRIRPGSPAPPALGGGSGSPTIRRYSRAASSSRSSSPSGIHMTLA